ncbi:MAG: glycosyltransferase family 9 protein [Planctomycetes bacterium]|nr:glycosyltransferase family 9 protein [Planctomycetota bacterium]
MRQAVVFHRGALGDSVLTWPLLRSLALRHDEVALVSDLSKARLAQRLGERRVLAIDAERPEFAALWRGEAIGAKIDADLVIHLCATPADDAGRAALDLWTKGAHEMYPGARIVLSAGVLNRNKAIELAKAHGRLVAVPRRGVPGGPVVMHIGAGSSEKRWPMPMWRALHQQFTTLIPGKVIRIIAGEVEEDRLVASERAMFTAMGGTFLTGLDQLASELEHASGFIGGDSGPTHVAGAMGIPTLALFGPTNPDDWAPIGPQVHILSPASPRGMAWLRPDEVASQAAALLA